MKIYYSDSAIPKKLTHAIFLAGPSPRAKEAKDWRLDAIKILKALKFKGEVFVPIPENKFKGGADAESWNYLNQIQWECTHRQLADKIVFWVARDIAGHMPGFTTNVEFGEDLATGKVLYGRPQSADKCRYLDERYKPQAVYDDLKALLAEAIKGQSCPRTGGEVYINSDVWLQKEFQEWYSNLKAAGNRLVSAQILNRLTIPTGQLFAYTLKVNVWVEAEKRHKDNEFVFFRRNTSSVLAYYKGKKKTYIVAVKEFRSPVNNSEGYVYELPGGSSWENIDMRENAAHELLEEAGIKVEPERFEFCGTRQIAATLCSYTTALYSVELTKEEFKQIKSGSSFGLQEDGECTHVQVIGLNKIEKYPFDYAMLGMIYSKLK